MSNAYLKLAEAILMECKMPLRSREILDLAYLRSLVPPHLHGPTQEKTLQARLIR